MNSGELSVARGAQIGVYRIESQLGEGGHGHGLPRARYEAQPAGGHQVPFERAGGLAAAHAAGITHRDIKPANILVARNGCAKLADFGLAKLTEGPAAEEATRTLAEEPTRPGMIVGTVAYMSPEQASGRPADARSDVFSFGVLLYELLAGRRPFAGATELEVLKTISLCGRWWWTCAGWRGSPLSLRAGHAGGCGGPLRAVRKIFGALERFTSSFYPTASRCNSHATASARWGPAVFSSDGARIAYTVAVDAQWDTWTAPVLGGQPSRMLTNAQGLTWNHSSAGPARVLFGECVPVDSH